jgi:uncharacterized protein YegJ (DUF2314 family)
MEDEKNIRSVCKKCSEERKTETQRNLPALSELVGKYVKKRFADENGGEHMWVQITSVNEEAGTLIGVLDNDPVVVKGVVRGDEVVVYRNEIEAILEE